MPIIRLCARCNQHATHGRYCAAHALEVKQQKQARNKAQDKIKGYHTGHWQRVRKARLELDSHTCTIQLPGCEQVATTVDLDPALHGNHRLATIETTRSACRRCHGAIDGGRRYGPRTFRGPERQVVWEGGA